MAPTGTPLPDRLYRVLLDGPDKLPLAVLDWLTQQVMLIARSLASDRHHRGEEGRYQPARVRGSEFPPVRELRFAVPPARRIPIYEDLIGRLEASLREGTDGGEAAKPISHSCGASSWKRSSKPRGTDATRPCCGARSRLARERLTTGESSRSALMQGRQERAMRHTICLRGSILSVSVIRSVSSGQIARRSVPPGVRVHLGGSQRLPHSTARHTARSGCRCLSR